MIGIVIVAHGGLAREYLNAITHVVGVQQNIKAIPIEDGHSRAATQDAICHAADTVDSGCGVVIVTDIFGGSPTNLALKAAHGLDRRIIYGANLPMLIKLTKSRRMSLTDATMLALHAGRKYIDIIE